MTGTAPQSGQLKDPFPRLGHGTGGLILKGFADQLAISGHFADRTIEVPASESVQSSLSKGDDVTLDCSPSDTDDLGGLPACDSIVQEPKNKHPFPDAQIGVSGPFFVNDSLLLVSELNTKPSHDVRPYGAKRVESISLRSGF